MEELRRAGFEPHLAEPAEARARKGPTRRAKTDRADARHLRDLLISDAVPESWIPPDHIADLRTKVRLRKALVGQRTAWQERIHAQLFHHGLPPIAGLLTVEGRARLGAAALPRCARQVVDLALRMIDTIDRELDPLDTELIRFARHQIGSRALMSHYGIGALTSVAILAELGDTRRFSSSRQAVRFAGLDVTVSESNGKRSRGRLSRQGPPALRWALYEAAKCAYRPQSPDHEYYLAVKERKGAQRACLSVARRLARRSHHTLAGPATTLSPSPPDSRTVCGIPGQTRIVRSFPQAPERQVPTPPGRPLLERAAATCTGNPITHHVAGPRRGPSTEIRPDARSRGPAVARWAPRPPRQCLDAPCGDSSPLDA